MKAFNHCRCRAPLSDTRYATRAWQREDTSSTSTPGDAEGGGLHQNSPHTRTHHTPVEREGSHDPEHKLITGH